jgi:hypothetical protein
LRKIWHTALKKQTNMRYSIDHNELTSMFINKTWIWSKNNITFAIRHWTWYLISHQMTTWKRILFQLMLCFFFFFFFNLGCPDQLTPITTNPRIHWTPCKPSRQVRHRGGDRRARWDSNPGDRGKETLPLPLGQKPRCT